MNKKMMFFLLGLALGSFLYSPVWAQKKYLLRTNISVKKLVLSNKVSGEKVKIKPFYGDNVFVIEVSSPDFTYIKFKESVHVSILDLNQRIVTDSYFRKKEEKNITSLFEEDSHIIDQSAFERYRLLFIAGKESRLLDFVSRGNVAFSGYLSTETICQPQDLQIAWIAENYDFSAELTQVPTGEVLWKKELLERPEITYELIKDELKKPLQPGNSYLFLITDLKDGETHNFAFNFVYFAFTGKKHNFFISDSVTFSWCNNAPVERLVLREKVSKKKLWEFSELQDRQALPASDIPDAVREQIQPKEEYIIEAHTAGENAKIYTKKFKVLFSPEEYDLFFNQGTTRSK